MTLTEPITTLNRASSANSTSAKRTSKKRVVVDDNEILQRAANAPLTDAMAMTLSHELSQPIAAVALRVEDAISLLEKAGDVSLAIDRLRKASTEIAYAGGVISQVRKLSRARSWTMGAVALNDAVDGALGLLEAEIEANSIDVQSRVTPSTPKVHGDRVMIQQVLVNLIRNAIEAMNGTPVKSRRIEIGAAANGAEPLILSVRDHGPGISKESLLQASTAFVSTKENGMGLGLNICRSIVALHKGRLWFQPAAEGPGAVFYMSLPRSGG